MVAALAYAWFLHNSATGKTWHAVAVIDIPRHQMHKRKDAAWLFDACGIDPAALLFADEVSSCGAMLCNVTQASHVSCTDVCLGIIEPELVCILNLLVNIR